MTEHYATAMIQGADQTTFVIGCRCGEIVKGRAPSIWLNWNTHIGVVQ